MTIPYSNEFCAAIAENPELQAKVSALLSESSESSLEELVKLSAETGFPIPVDAWRAAVEESREISDADLGAVAGGGRVSGRTIAEVLSNLRKEEIARREREQAQAGG